MLTSIFLNGDTLFPYYSNLYFGNSFIGSYFNEEVNFFAERFNTYLFLKDFNLFKIYNEIVFYSTDSDLEPNQNLFKQILFLFSCIFALTFFSH